MGFPRKRPQGGNAFRDYKGSSFVDPLAVDYRKLKPGASIRLRFLDLSAESVAVIPCRAVTLTNPKTGQNMTIKDIHEPEDPELMHDIFDHTGTPMSSCETVNLFRAPVYVFYCKETPNSPVEDINALRYLEFTQGLKNSMDKMEEFQQGMGQFNQETGRPDYDVDLVITEGSGGIPKSYEFQPVMFDSATKKTHAHWGMEAEEVLQKLGVMEVVDAEWDSVQERIQKRMTEAEIRQRVEVKGANDSNGGGGGVSQRMAGRDSAPDEAQEPARGGFGGGRPSGDGPSSGRRYNRG